MKIHLRPPSVATLRRRADEQRDLSVTYEPVGVTASTDVPDGYRRSVWSRSIGAGRDDFAVGAAYLRSWGVQSGSGLIVAADADVAPGVIAAMAAPLPIGWIEVVCRVVAVTATDDEWSFTYGTLPEHPEQGEERFAVHLRESGHVEFEIVAVSRARNPLARLVPPVARALQDRATTRYLDAIEQAVAAAR